MPKMTWKGYRTCQWTIGSLGVSCAGHPRTETQDDVGHAGSEKGNGVPLDRKESGEVH